MTRSQFVFGLLFVALGALLLADQAGLVATWAVIADWWPTVIVLSGLARLVTRPRNAAGGILLVVIGGALLLWTLGTVGTITLVWPVLLIGLGVWLMVTRPGGGRGHSQGSVVEDRVVAGRVTTSRVVEGLVQATAVFENRAFHAAPGHLDGGSVTAVFGNVSLDLRTATLDDNGVRLRVTTVFGDVALDIPVGWQLRVSGPEIFGTVTTDGVAPPPAGGPVLRLDVVTVFGDVSVRSSAGREVDHQAKAIGTR